MPATEELLFQYEVAEGTVALRTILDNFFEQAKTDAEFARVGHYILYSMGEQRSLIRVDTSSVPFHFLYCDSFGRPATKPVREAIAKFLWEKCGEKERFMKAHTGSKSQ